MDGNAFYSHLKQVILLHKGVLIDNRILKVRRRILKTINAPGVVTVKKKCQ
jgi:hypothetical protein